MKNWISGFMWCANLVTCIFFYNLFQPQEGYDDATRARMDDIVAQITPLSVADLGVDYE